MTKNNFLTQFQKRIHPLPLPQKFVKLVEFIKSNPYITDNFYFRNSQSKYFSPWIEAKEKKFQTEFLQSIIPFANANEDESRYAFWMKPGIDNIEEAPVIFFGEGGGTITIIALNLTDFIKILSFGNDFDELLGYTFHNENMGSNYEKEMEEYYREDFHEYYPDFIPFRKWISKELKIKPIDGWQNKNNKEVEKIQKKAILALQQSFDEWLIKYVPNLEKYKTKKPILYKLGLE